MISNILINSALLDARKKTFDIDDFLRGFKHVNPEIVSPYEHDQTKKLGARKKKPSKNPKMMQNGFNETNC